VSKPTPLLFLPLGACVVPTGHGSACPCSHATPGDDLLSTRSNRGNQARHTPPGGERKRPPCSTSYRRAEGIDGAEAEPASVEKPARDQFLQRVLHHRPVEAEPDGAGHLIGGRAVRLLCRDRGQDLRCRGRRAGRRRRVRVLCYGNACLPPVLSGDTACLCRHATPPILYPLLFAARPSGRGPFLPWGACVGPESYRRVMGLALAPDPGDARRALRLVHERVVGIVRAPRRREHDARLHQLKAREEAGELGA